MRRIGWVAVVLMAAGIAGWGLFAVVRSSGPGQDPAAAEGRTVTDLAGRAVVVPERVERLVALGPGAMRLVAYLGATDRVVGTEDMERRMERDIFVRPYGSTLDEAFLALPIVGSGGPGVLPDPEKILMCKPDVAVAIGLDPAQLNNLEAKTGVPMLYLSYGELGVWREEARQSLTLLGDVLGLADRAAELNATITSLEADLAARTAGIPEADMPTAYFGGISHKGAHGIDSTEAGYPPARMAGAYNLADGFGQDGHFFVDREQILVWQPDFIFVDRGSRLILEQDVADNREYYRLLEAVAAERIFSLLSYNYYNTNMELALINAYFIGKALYPERFADVDMREQAGAILEAFLGIRPDRDPPAYRPLRIPDEGPVQWE